MKKIVKGIFVGLLVVVVLFLFVWAFLYVKDQHILQCEHAGYTYDQCLILLRYY